MTAGNRAIRRLAANFARHSGWTLIGFSFAFALLGGLPRASALQTSLPPANTASANNKAALEYAKLEAELTKASDSKQAEVLARLAELDLQSARTQLLANDLPGGEARLKLMHDRAGHALALLQTEALNNKKDGMKQVEESFDRIDSVLTDLAHGSGAALRPELQSDADDIAAMRENVLKLLFAAKTKKGG